MKNKKILIPLVAGVLFSTSLGGYLIYSQSSQEKPQTEQKDKNKPKNENKKITKKEKGLSESEQKQLDKIQVEENPKAAINKLLNNDEKEILGQIRSRDTPQLFAKIDQNDREKDKPVIVASEDNNKAIGTPIPEIIIPEEKPKIPINPVEPEVPIEPINPTEPSNPIEPSNPTEPENPGGGSEINPPVIVNTPPTLKTESLTLHVGKDFNEEIVRKSVHAYDEEDGNLTEFVKIDLTSVDTKREGTYPIVYSVSDSNKTTVTVTNYVNVVNKAPKISNAKDKVIHVNEHFDLEKALEGVSVFDYEEGDLTSKLNVDTDELIAIQEALKLKNEGEFTLTYFVSDSYGKMDKKIITVSIINEAPVFSGLDAVILQLGQLFTLDNALEGVTANDYEDGDVTSNIEINKEELTAIQKAISDNTEGTFELTYTVKDSLNKETVVKRVISIINEEPVITLPIHEITLTIGDVFEGLDGVTAHDKEDGDITDKIVVIGTVDTSKAGTTMISYDVTDSNGKKAETKYLTVHVIEKEGEGENDVE